MLSVVIEICKNIIDFVKNEGDLRLEERLRISFVLEEISNILLDTAKKLRADEYPHFNCVLIEKMANDLHFYLIDQVKPEDLDSLHKVLIEASQVEKQFALRHEHETIPEIEKAAAEFKTMSLLMKF